MHGADLAWRPRDEEARAAVVAGDVEVAGQEEACRQPSRTDDRPLDDVRRRDVCRPVDVRQLLGDVDDRDLLAV